VPGSASARPGAGKLCSSGVFLGFGENVAGRPFSYRGQGFSLRGEKGRYVLPPSFRKAIAPTEDDPRILCLTRHAKWNCLSGFGLSRTDSFPALLDREEENALRLGKDFDRDTRDTQLWTFSEIPFDASGRFVLPDHLAELGAIEDAICFLGGSDSFTLWNPERLYEMGEGWQGPQAMCRKLAEDASAKGKRR
jgi:MraZ protein